MGSTRSACAGCPGRLGVGRAGPFAARSVDDISNLIILTPVVVNNDVREAIIGRELSVFEVAVGRDPLRWFAQVLGFADPVYHDVDAARAAGYPDLLVPPTYLFSLELRRPDPYGVVRELGFKESQLLHGGQEFGYHAPAFAGD